MLETRQEECVLIGPAGPLSGFDTFNHGFLRIIWLSSIWVLADLYKRSS